MNGNNGEAYNVGNPNETKSIYELALIISNIYPKLKINVVKELQELSDINYLKSPIMQNSPNIEKIKKLYKYYINLKI